MYALINDMLRATEKWAENEDTDTATVETSIMILYKKGEGARIVSAEIPFCLEKYIDMAYDRPPIQKI